MNPSRYATLARAMAALRYLTTQGFRAYLLAYDRPHLPFEVRGDWGPRVTVGGKVRLRGTVLAFGGPGAKPPPGRMQAVRAYAAGRGEVSRGRAVALEGLAAEG